MSDTGKTTSTGESPNASKAAPGAPKDRNCPFCGQAFTSSSLGRHLDLYIKNKNPKGPDGIHDVEAIRKLRGNITRRQPRSSLRRDTSTPSTPVSTRKSPAPLSNSIPKDGQFAVDHQSAPRYPYHTSWEATGVINDIPAKNVDSPSTADDVTPLHDTVRKTSTKQQTQPPPPPQQQRVTNRASQKSQFDVRQKLSDTMDTARAAELALREILSSWRAAKQQIDMNSMPFDFDPLALDFPALTLQCLQAPPTLFSSTPHPNSTSWSIQPPAHKQFEALRSYFQDHFKKWRATCAMATTAMNEDLTYPPSTQQVSQDARENIKKAEKAAWSLEKQVYEHLQSAYQVWEQLPPQRKSELWGLELARSVGRRQRDLEKLKSSQHSMRQENSNLKAQIEQLNRLQQPREYRIVPPATIPIEESILSYMWELGAQERTGFCVEDRHLDLTTVVARAIERWKTVIVSTRASGMNTQRSLDCSTLSSSASATQGLNTQSFGTGQNQRRLSAAGHGDVTIATAVTAANQTTDVTNTMVSTGADENSDQDADAEMEEDGMFGAAPVAGTLNKPDQQPQLEVARTRRNVQQPPANPNGRFIMNSASGRGRRVPVQNTVSQMDMSGSVHGGQNQSHTMISNGEYNAAVSGAGIRGERLYINH